MQNLKRINITRIYPFKNEYIYKRAISAEVDPIQYQLLQRSKLPTLYFQKSLPHLPVPKLENSCERFLAAVKPLLDQEEYEHTVRTVAEFQSGEGSELQEILQQSDNANKHTNYISQLWFDMYLSDRIPLPLNYNPLLIMKSSKQNQLVRATNLVISSMRFWRSLQADLLEPEIYHMNAAKTDTERFRNIMRFVPQAFATYAAYALKAFPLDMSQFNRLFGVSRIPHKGKDVLIQSKTSKHILVMRGGNMYAVDVLDDNGNIEQPNIILGRLQKVLEMEASSGPSKVPLGTLTTMNRDEWASVRQHLTNNVEGGSENKYLLENEIDAALFCLCFDKPEDPVYKEEKMAPLLKQLLAGDGRNRWFDKSTSLLVSADGTAAVNFEHSWGDGVAVLRYFNEVYKETTENPFVSAATDAKNVADSKSVRPIQLKVDKAIEQAVQKASANHTQLMTELNVDILRYPYINKSICKRLGVSPDAIMQLSFQLAYKRAFNDYVGTYESCSTSAFRHGRTETVRPCTVATKQFCDSYMQANKDQLNASELFNLIKQCSQLHGKLTKEAAMGQGFDRHLFALKHKALEHNRALPKIYETKAYTKLNYNILSTSTLASNAVLAGCFGPVVPDGLGVAYSMQDESCGAVVTSYEKKRNGKDFVDNLTIALDDIYKVLKNNSK